MALTPEQIAGYQAAAEEIAQPVIEWLLKDIVERVLEAGKMTSAAAYEAYRAEALGLARKDLEKYLKAQLRITKKQAEQLLSSAAEFAQKDDYARVGVWATEADAGSLLQLTEAAVKLAGEQLENITQTTGMVSPATGKPLPLQDAYRECMDKAFKLVATGATSASEAARQATRKLAGRGIVTIDYASGISTELGAAVRRNLMGGMGLLVEQVTQQNHDALGCNGWEISAHANSAPDHEPIQGRQYSDAEFQRLNGNLARRIGTLNCGHVAFPILLGINSPQYTDAELEAFRQDNARGVTYEGRHMTGYEATQYQNRVERNIRTQKQRVLMSEAAGDESQLLTDRIKLARLNQEYARFNKAMGFKSRAERLEVVGWSRRQAGKASAAARSPLATSENSATIKMVSGARIIDPESKAADLHAARYYGLVRSMKTDVAKIAQNTEFDKEKIAQIKKFIFLDKHDLGGVEPEYFAPDFAMAQSWQRLINGTPEPHDLTLLRHEIMEKELMDTGLSQSQAHNIANQTYNYGEGVKQYYGALKKHRNRR